MSYTRHYSEGVVTKQNIFENLLAVNPETNELKNPPHPPAKKVKPKRKKTNKSSKSNKENSENGDKSGNEEKSIHIEEKSVREHQAEEAEVKPAGHGEQKADRSPQEEATIASPTHPPSTAQSTPTPMEGAELQSPTNTDPAPTETPLTKETAPSADQSESVTQPTPASYPPPPRYGYPTMQFVNSNYKRGGRGGRGGRGAGGDRREDARPGRNDSAPGNKFDYPPRSSNSSRPLDNARPGGPNDTRPTRPNDRPARGGRNPAAKPGPQATSNNQSGGEAERSTKPEEKAAEPAMRNRPSKKEKKEAKSKESGKEVAGGKLNEEVATKKDGKPKETDGKGDAVKIASPKGRNSEPATTTAKGKSLGDKQPSGSEHAGETPTEVKKSPKAVDGKRKGQGEKPARGSEERSKAVNDVTEAAADQNPDQADSGHHRGQVEEHQRPQGERQRYSRGGGGEERDRDTRPRGGEDNRSRGYGGPPSQNYKQESGPGRRPSYRYTDGPARDESSGGYRRSFYSDGGSQAPPPRRGRNSGTTYRSSGDAPRARTQAGPYGDTEHRARPAGGGSQAADRGQANGYVSSEEDRRGGMVNGDSAGAPNKRRPYGRNGRGDRRPNPNEVSSIVTEAQEVAVNNSADGTVETIAEPRVSEPQTDSGASLVNGSLGQGDGTRDANGKIKKWSDESWEDDVPRKPSPYEEQTNRVKVTHESVNVPSSESIHQMVREVQGDLMAAPEEYSLAIGVSEDFRMPSGLPAQFRSEFRRLDTLLDQNCRVGDVASLGPLAKTDHPSTRHVFFLVTKKMAHSRTALNTLGTCLVNLRKECVRKGVRCLAMPQLGSGPDRLDWHDVKALLSSVFDEADIQVLVYMQNEDQEQSETKGPKARQTGVKLVIEKKPVVAIEEWTSIVVFTSVDGNLNSAQIQSLHGKFGLVDEFEAQLADATIGSVITLKRSNYFISFFIVAPSSSPSFKFESISKCMVAFKKHLHKDQIVYVAFEALPHRNAPNNLLNEKLVSFMKNNLPFNISLHVCWPDSVEDRYFISRTKPSAGTPRIKNASLVNGSLGQGDGTRDANGKMKKWSDESWEDDVPRKPSPYEEQTNRVKVTHESVNVPSSESIHQMVREVQGDLMAAPEEYSLAIGVSEDFRMPSGLPAQFRSEFRRLDTLLDQNCRVGDVASLGPLAKTDHPSTRHVFYLVTKKMAHSRTALNTLGTCLVNLRKECVRKGVRCLAMPQFGFGPDRLDWHDVKALLSSVFDEADIQVLVYMQNEDQEQSETKGPKARQTGVKLVIEKKPVVAIEEWTSIVVFTSVDGNLNSAQIQSLHGKFGLVDEFEAQLADATIGSVITLKRSNYFISFFIVAPSSSPSFKFESISKCMVAFKKHLHKDQIVYVAFEALPHRNAPNNLLNEKLVSFMKNNLPFNISLHVCWPDSVEDRYFISRTKPSAGTPRIENGNHSNGRFPSNAKPSYNTSGFHGNESSHTNSSRPIQIDSNRHFPKL